MTFTCLYCLFEIHISLNILNKLIEWVFKLILFVILYIYIYIYIERERERESRAIETNMSRKREWI
jgi:ABC-type transport system involved in Fe-S cluster assembly fused permease/ATPase subunit